MQKKKIYLGVVLGATLIALCAALFSFRMLQTARTITGERPIIESQDSSLLEHEIRSIVREEYAAYMSEMNTMVLMFGFLITFLAVVVPIMIQRERARELDVAIEKSKELKVRLQEDEKTLETLLELNEKQDKALFELATTILENQHTLFEQLDDGCAPQPEQLTLWKEQTLSAIDMIDKMKNKQS